MTKELIMEINEVMATEELHQAKRSFARDLRLLAYGHGILLASVLAWSKLVGLVL